MKIIRQNLASLLIITYLLLWEIPAVGQVTIGSGLTPSPGAILDLKEEVDGTSKKGIVIPRVKLVNRTIPSGETLAQTIQGTAPNSNWDKDEHIGLMVYNTNPIETSANRVCPGIHVWNGEEWLPLLAYPEALERKVQDETISIIRSFEYLESDPAQANFNKSLWPADKQAAAQNGDYILGNTKTQSVKDLQNNDYKTSRFYVGYRLLTVSYKTQRSYRCNASETPNWVDTGETSTQTEKIFTDGIWTTESMRTTAGIPKQDGTVAGKPSATEPRYHHPSKGSSITSTQALLYNWAAATNSENNLETDDTGGSQVSDIQMQGICPDGWHLPSDQEWTDLENGIILKTNTFSSTGNIGSPLLDYDGANRTAVNLGTAMKTTTSIGAATGGTSKTSALGGFDAYLVGHITTGDASTEHWHTANFWSASNSSVSQAWSRRMTNSVVEPGNQKFVTRPAQDKSLLLSVRCKKNDN